MNIDEFAELSAGHALGALSPDDEAAFAAARAEHPEWESVVDSDEETATALAEGVAPVSPPLALRSQLLSAITASTAPAPHEPEGDAPEDDDTPTRVSNRVLPAEAAEPAPIAADAADSAEVADAAPPTEVVQAIQRRTWSRGVFALVASIALLVGIGWGAGSVSRLWQTPPAVTALQQIEDAPDASSADAAFDGGTATVHWSESLGKVVLVADGLPALDADRTFELWYVRAGTAIPAGTFDASGATATAQLTGQMQPGDTIAVTVEPSGGSPDGTPSTDPVLAVPTA
ncbi:MULTISPECIES: anti-sigma factor [unclassified Microbacterium]|uniref:anti-sigma factor n=1 Tax=unclassified Microbacterium TaxID=2609290 RepID=UPI003019B5FA